MVPSDELVRARVRAWRHVDDDKADEEGAQRLTLGGGEEALLEPVEVVIAVGHLDLADQELDPLFGVVRHGVRDDACVAVGLHQRFEAFAAGNDARLMQQVTPQRLELGNLHQVE